MAIKGGSTGCPPIQVKIIMLAIKSQKRVWARGRKAVPCCFALWSIGIIAKIRIERKRARTPPNLLGIERRIA